MTNEDRLRIAEATLRRAEEGPRLRSCGDCRWVCHGPGYTAIQQGKGCDNPVLILHAGVATKPDKKDRRVHNENARSGSGLCGPDAIFFESKSWLIRKLEALLDD